MGPLINTYNNYLINFINNYIFIFKIKLYKFKFKYINNKIINNLLN